MTTYDLVLDVMRQAKIDVDGIDHATRLREDLQVDSTEMIEIAVAIEQRTATAIDTDDVLALKTFGDLLAYVDHAGPRT